MNAQTAPASGLSQHPKPHSGQDEKSGKIEKLSPRIAAQRAGCTVWDIYRLCRAGFLVVERPTPRKMLIINSSLQSHLAATRDPEFWDTHSL